MWGRKLECQYIKFRFRIDCHSFRMLYASPMISTKYNDGIYSKGNEKVIKIFHYKKKPQIQRKAIRKKMKNTKVIQRDKTNNIAIVNPFLSEIVLDVKCPSAV